MSVLFIREPPKKDNLRITTVELQNPVISCEAVKTFRRASMCMQRWDWVVRGILDTIDKSTWRNFRERFFSCLLSKRLIRIASV